jgi:probable phosphoglycerate mutase
VLLRHGRTAWNAEHRFQGQADPPLDDVGRRQAYEVAALIAALRPGLLITSDAARAAQTAEIVAAAAGIPPIVEPRFRERSLGHWEGLTREEVETRYPDEYADWVAGREIGRRGGETREDVAERAQAAFRELPVVPVAVIVTHSATAMSLTNALLGVPQRLRALGPLANCHWSELADDTNQWRLRGHNLGVPGTIVPIPAHQPAAEDAPDAEA